MPASDRGVVTALIQPEYFPPCDVVAALLVADRILIGDTFQYSRQSFHNRCAVRTPDGRQWLTVPVLGGQHGVSINETRIDDRVPWQRRHWKSLAFNYGTAPFFEHYADAIRAIIFGEYATLGELTAIATQRFAELAGSSADCVTLSSIGDPGGWGGWQERLGVARGVTAARQAPAGIRDSGSLPELHLEYQQNFGGFEDGLSAIDLLFNVGPDSADLIRDQLARDAGAGAESSTDRVR